MHIKLFNNKDCCNLGAKVQQKFGICKYFCNKSIKKPKIPNNLPIFCH